MLVASLSTGCLKSPIVKPPPSYDPGRHDVAADDLMVDPAATSEQYFEAWTQAEKSLEECEAQLKQCVEQADDIVW